MSKTIYFFNLMLFSKVLFVFHKIHPFEGYSLMSFGDSTQLYTLQSKKSPCTLLLLIPSPNPDPH